MYAPINGSQINPKAKLYKKYTVDQETLINANVITYQLNNYVCRSTFAWVESTGYNEEDYQPIRGLVTRTASMTIKMSAPYFKRLGNFKIPDIGDIVQLNGEYWMVEDGIQKERHKTLKDLATYYLPLTRLML